MPLPTLLKTWQRAFNLSNTPTGVADTDLKNLFLLVWNVLLGGALPGGASGGQLTSNPWVCAGSSNAAAAGMDGVNRITVLANITCAGAGTAHSWAVMTSAAGVQVCFDFVHGAQMQVKLVWSPDGGFTGGSTTARPTALHEQVLADDWLAADATLQFRGHVMHSSDGKCTRVFLCGNGNVLAFWSFEEAFAPVAGWTLPQVALAFTVGNNEADNSCINFNKFYKTTAKYSALGPIGTMPLFVTGESGTATGDVMVAFFNNNEISLEYQIQGCGLLHTATIGQRGRHGFVADLFFTTSAPLTGDTFPASGAHTFTVLGDMAVPSGGLTMLLG